jgi:serine/threonine-protein kinase
VDPQSNKLPWARIEALFPDLLALPPARRPAFLDRHCAGAPALRAELEALLLAAERESCLDHPLSLDSTQAPRTPPPMHADEQLGAWRIVHLLGRGGMGEVYLAERIEGGFAQTAAIKRLRVDAIEHTERFDAERSILAQLDHPHIARLLGGGISADGRAWMAMDYVEGENLVDYCRTHALDLAGRVALFEQICSAVAYAHAHLVVHRDLKPSNILVTRGGQAKLLDFGIAKLLDHGNDVHLTRTAPLTPDHAAPEQLEGGAATTAVDIYTLGVLLYELLCGQRPWASGSTPISLVVDRLLREEPPPPSRAVGGTRTAAALKQLRGDLDAIVLRCMRKSPCDRYPTVDALREDLQRWREHRPVEARRGAAGYALRRWLWRHRIGLAAASVVFAALLAGLGTALWQAREAQHQAWRAERVKDLVLTAFRENDPLSRPDNDRRTPAQLIAVGVARADQQLAGDPNLHAELLDDFGEIQLNLGDLEGGRATLQRALAQRQQLYHGDHILIAETMRKLASAYQVEGRYDEGLATANQALAMLDRLGESQSVEAARLKMGKGVVLITRKQREEALQLQREAQQVLEQKLGRNDPLTVLAVYRVGQALEQLRRDAEAETVTRDAVQRLETSVGIDSPQLIRPLSLLAGVLRRKAPDRADAVYDRAIALTRRYFPGRSLALSQLLNAQANMHRMLNHLPRAEALFIEAEAALLPVAKAEHAQLLASRGQMYLQMDRLAEAERDLHQSFLLRRETLGEKSGLTWYGAALWGRALRQLGRLEQAETVQRDALTRLQQIMGPDAYQNVLLLDALVETLDERGKHDEAIALGRRSLALTGKTYPPIHPLQADRTYRLAKALAHAPGNAARAEAISRCDQAVDIYRKAGSPNAAEHIDTLLGCAELGLSLKHPDGIRDKLQQVLLLTKDKPADNPRRVHANQLLAAVDALR